MNEKSAALKKEPEEIKTDERHVVALAESRWQLKEHQNPGGWICVPFGTAKEDLLRPVFWANVARHLRPCTTVEVHWDDRSYFAQVYVLSNGRNWANVAMLNFYKLERPANHQQSEQYVIAFNGPVDKFRITRVSDGAVIRAGFNSEREARTFLDEYMRKLGM